jgi:hypothetical protein
MSVKATYHPIFMAFLGKCLPPDPVAGVVVVTSGYGPRQIPGNTIDAKAGGRHNAIDSAYSKIHPAPPGKYPIYCPFAGTVTTVSLGGLPHCNAILIDDHHGQTHGFLHGSNIAVKAGQSISAGQLLCYMDKVGASAVHFHYQIHSQTNGQPLDPEAFWAGTKQTFTNVTDQTTYNIAAANDPFHNQKSEPAGGSTVADYMPRQAATAPVVGGSTASPALWTNRVPSREPWPRTLMVDTPNLNASTDEHERNTSHNPQFDNVDETGRALIGKVDGDTTYPRGPLWRR